MCSLKQSSCLLFEYEIILEAIAVCCEIHPARGRCEQSLEAPLQHVSDINSLIGSESHEVSPREQTGRVARLAEGAKDLAVLVEFDDAILSAVNHPNVLVWRDQQTVGVTDAGPSLDEFAVGVEDLDPLIFAIADLYAALIVDRDGVRQN
jgi:hypothetical protein